ncbi:uncharacterized protein G2W53_004759 [Senna tora]|uniref:Uncharacterized protein n=1 Tax=Senna tora TaxID=362788 RepID=A0A835CIF2_9FABA|nr:uncharacterized protein G2W53_004759 [Senna tora]
MEYSIFPFVISLKVEHHCQLPLELPVAYHINSALSQPHHPPSCGILLHSAQQPFLLQPHLPSSAKFESPPPPPCSCIWLPKSLPPEPPTPRSSSSFTTDTSGIPLPALGVKNSSE